MSSSLSLILDDDSGDFTYSGGEWTLSTLVQWYKETSWWPSFATGSTLGSFSLSFEGTSVAFVGNTPPEGLSQSATVSIDGGAPTTISYGGSPPSYMQWYKSPSLSDGKHTITVGNLATTSVDFAVITAGSNTPLSGKTALVDDADSAIAYSGSWTQSSDGFDAGTLPDGYPFGRSTHRSSNVGDSLSFRFTGTSASVYGIINWANLGVLSATYSLDGKSTSQSYSVTTSSPEFVSQDHEASNFQLFSSNTLSAGDHTLVITITQCTNQAFVLDYITYTPSFSTLASLPNLSPVAPNFPGATAPPSSPSLPASQLSNSNSNLASHSVTSASPTSGSGSSTTNSIPLPVGSESTSPSSSAGAVPDALANQNNSNSQSKDVPIGPIVGAVLGGLLLIALLALFVLLRRRRNEKRLAVESVARNDLGAPYYMDQHRSAPLSSGVSPFPSLRHPANHGFPPDSKRMLATDSSDPLAGLRATSPSIPNYRGDASAPTPTTAVTSHTSGSLELVHPPSYEAISRQSRSPLPS